MRKILITGANGLISHEITKRLLENSNNKVIGISRSKSLFSNSNYTHYECDITGVEFDSLLSDKPDVICHLAQSENFRDFPDKAKQIFNVNTQSTINLLDYAVRSGCKKFVYASSGGVYGNSNVGFNEEDPIVAGGELGFYLGTKFCSEILAESYSRFFDVNIARFFFVYGARQRKTMFIPRLVNSIKEGTPITLQGKEGIKVNPIHVSDAAKAVAMILDTKGSFKINIAGSEVLSLKEICESIACELNTNAKYIFEDKEPKHLIGNIEKMEKLLMEPSVKFADGIKELL